MEIYNRLAALQAEIENPKNSTENPFYKSKYAPLPDILELARPLLGKHGLAVLQYPETRMEGTVPFVGVRTIICLGGLEKVPEGESTSIDCGWLGLPQQGLDAQKVGAIITYFRRYALKAVLGIESEDDDANSAVSSPEKKSAKTAPAQKVGNVAEIKAQWAAAKTSAEQDAVLKAANEMTWDDVSYQELAIFFETELSKRAALAAAKKAGKQAAPASAGEQTAIPEGGQQ